MPEPCARTSRLPAWLPWFIGRLGYGLLTAWVISLVVFIATQALPSDPARVILGPEAPLESVLTLREQLGLNRPILVQYLSWLGQVLRGDLGISLDSNQPVPRSFSAVSAIPWRCWPGCWCWWCRWP